MTVRDLYNWCKAYRYKDAKVYMVGDWEEVDEEGLVIYNDYTWLKRDEFIKKLKKEINNKYDKR